MTQDNPYQPPAADAPMMGGALSEGQYEFSLLENSTIDKTGRRARIWGVISLIIGVLLLLGGLVLVAGLLDLPAGIGAALAPLVLAVLVPLGIVYLVMGKLYMDSGQALRLVVTTEGNDVELMLRGIDKMANAFRIEVILTVVALAAGFILGLTGAALS